MNAVSRRGGGFLVLMCLTLLSVRLSGQQPLLQKFQQVTDSIYNSNPSSTGIIVSIQAQEAGKSWNYAVGVANRKSGEPLQPGNPVLIASNTKTYVAASVLLLVELDKLSLDDSIGQYIAPESKRKMVEAGYNPTNITVKHLLSHTSGIVDYVDDAYFDKVHANQHYAWTRREQINRAFEKQELRVLPGDTFMYADINYVLLTELIEQVQQKPFYTAMRDLLNFELNGLHSTWFTQLETVPEHTLPLAHQYWSERSWDSHQFNPSWDLYGGGGMVATTADLASFFNLLYNGQLIRDRTLLNEMCTPPFAHLNTNYGLGVRIIKMAGLTAYYHGGFWGSDALYIPDLNTSVSIVVLERSERAISAMLCKRLIELLKSE